MKSLKDLNIKSGTRVILRADFNITLKDGKVDDDFRIRATLPTIEYLRKLGARILILSHLGRPKGRYDQSLSLTPIAEDLGKRLDLPIKFFKKIEIAENEISEMKNGEVAVLENLRFDKREEEGDKTFAKELAALGDVYVCDAFGAAHRKHTSVYHLPQIMPHAAGLLLEKEVEVLNEVRTKPARPLVFVMGGSKVETKLKTLSKLFADIDEICLAGLMANSLLVHAGVDLGKSWREENIEDYIDGIDLQDKKVHLPVDVLVSADPSGKRPVRVSDISKIQTDEMALDAGPKTIEDFINTVKNAGMVVWNGPLGLIEVDEFANGTRDLARSLLQTKAKVVVGGGDLMRVIDEVGAAEKVYFTSTGGGAMLEYLAEGTLPALEVLD